MEPEKLLLRQGLYERRGFALYIMLGSSLNTRNPNHALYAVSPVASELEQIDRLCDLTSCFAAELKTAGTSLVKGFKIMFFEYGEKETEYLKSKDARLAEVIETVGHIHRFVDNDLFSSVVHHIIGQQISTKAQQTIWQRMIDTFGEVNAESIGHASVDELQSLGMTFRKAEYIRDFSLKIKNGEFDLAALKHMTDEDAISALASLKGIGVWTAEMILLFCLQRPNILSYDDLAIQRGMRMVYHHRKIDRRLFEKYRRRLSPYCSVASLYFWAVAGGAIPELRDYAPRKK